MSGICGYAGAPPDEGLLRRMAARLVHRGPDDEGFLLTPKIGLGMRRLSLVDGECGRQPQLSEDRRVALVFDGEIYNHAQLREQLQTRGHRFTTRSDAEVLVQLYEERGRDALLELRGNFALALYDGRRRSLLLARDRLGVKPLYCTLCGGRLLFASELKALLADPAVSVTPHLPSIDAYLKLRYVPGSDTLIKGVWRLPPGCWLEWRDGRVQSDHYWVLPPRPRDVAAAADSEQGEEDERRFEALLREGLELHRMGDVSQDTYLRRDLARQPVVAEDLQYLPEILYALEEPQVDADILPTFLRARDVAQRRKVVLTDAGAGEILGSSAVHQLLDRMRRYRGAVPGWLHRRGLAPAAGVLPERWLNSLFAWLCGGSSELPGLLQTAGKQKLLRLVRLAGADVLEVEAAYRLLVTLFDDSDRSALYAPDTAAALVAARVGELQEGWSDEFGAAAGDLREAEVFLDHLLRLQLRDELPDNLLHRQGKLAMAHGLELRTPFLDHELVEFLTTVPASLKLPGAAGKSPLQQSAERTLGQVESWPSRRWGHLVGQRSVPEPAFRELLDQTLRPERVARRGLFRPELVAALVESLDGRLDRHLRGHDLSTLERVMSLSLLELWYQVFVDAGQQPSSSIVDRAVPRPAVVLEDGR